MEGEKCMIASREIPDRIIKIEKRKTNALLFHLNYQKVENA